MLRFHIKSSCSGSFVCQQHCQTPAKLGDPNQPKMRHPPTVTQLCYVCTLSARLCTHIEQHIGEVLRLAANLQHQRPLKPMLPHSHACHRQQPPASRIQCLRPATQSAHLIEQVTCRDALAVHVVLVLPEVWRQKYDMEGQTSLAEAHNSGALRMNTGQDPAGKVLSPMLHLTHVPQAAQAAGACSASCVCCLVQYLTSLSVI